ncbi:MAG: hypothetical protein ACRDHZ_13870, partial [Ktedonobacteraceae bacterium]
RLEMGPGRSVVVAKASLSENTKKAALSAASAMHNADRWEAYAKVLCTLKYEPVLGAFFRTPVAEA